MKEMQDNGNEQYEWAEYLCWSGDFESAIPVLTQLISEDSVKALELYAGNLLKKGMDEDDESKQVEALHVFRNAAKLGSAAGKFACAQRILLGELPDDFVPVKDYLYESAEANYLPSLLWLGLLYLEGDKKEFSTDLELSVHFLERASDFNNVKAQIALLSIYFDKDGEFFNLDSGMSLLKLVMDSRDSLTIDELSEVKKCLMIGVEYQIPEALFLYGREKLVQGGERAEATKMINQSASKGDLMADLYSQVLTVM